MGTHPSASEIRRAFIELRQILLVISQLANEFDMQEMQPETHSSCREHQLKILFDDNIAEEDKRGLIEVTRYLLNGEGIDISNADDILEAINERDRQLERKSFEHDIRVKAAKKFEDYLDTSYDLTKADPEYKRLVGFASKFIVTQVSSVVYEDSSDIGIGSFSFELLTEQAVTSLGLKMADIVNATKQIATGLVREI